MSIDKPLNFTPVIVTIDMPSNFLHADTDCLVVGATMDQKDAEIRKAR